MHSFQVLPLASVCFLASLGCSELPPGKPLIQQVKVTAPTTTPATTPSRDIRSDSQWPGWRGPDGAGHSDETGLPVAWDAKNVVWTTQLKGRGQSSPIAWQDRIFLTTATERGARREVVCIDRKNGHVLWERVAWTGEPEGIHSMNSWASPTCATDGQRVVACFGNGGLHCYDLNGNILWSRDLGRFENANWGFGSSPIIVENLVIQACDADNDAFLVAIDKQSGAEVWRTPRPKSRSFSTPLLINTGARRELVINGHSGMRSYDPSTGKELWFCTGGSGRGTPTVVTGRGLVIVLSGRTRGDGDLMAFRPGGSGDVTVTHNAWHVRRGGRDLPSPIVVDDFLIVANLRTGIGSCYDVTTGKLHWKNRLHGRFSASPIETGGLVYILSESGETIVIKPDREYREVARSRLNAEDDEVFRTSLMPYAGHIFCRSDKRLYCIGNGTSAKQSGE